MLKTKLNKPSATSKLIYRKELVEKLETAHEKKLTLVSAPAGYGKSTLISQWIDKLNLTYSWYSIDKSDNEPTEFFRYLIAAVQTHKDGFGNEVLRLFNSANNATIETIASLFNNDLIEIKDEIFVVLDDFHLISQIEIFDAINFLLDHLPESAHIILLTRSDPPIPFSRLRSQDQLLELRLSDLSFSANEIDTFFNKKLKLGIKKSEIYSLESKTEGWAAGLQLAAISIQSVNDTSAFIEDFTGSNRYIMDYLIEEVMRTQTPEFQSFLLRTSILKQMSAPLCNAILGRNDSQLILERLDKTNMFVIPLDSDRKWYRYHHLFAELLKQRLLLEEENTIIEDFHKKASLWLEENGMYNDAIEHSLVIGDYKHSLNIISNVIESLWIESKHTAILKYGESLPDELIKQYPVFCLYYAWIIRDTGDVKKALIYLSNAKELVSAEIKNNKISEEERTSKKNLLGRIDVAFAYLLTNDEANDITLEYCKSAVKNLSSDDDLWLGWAWYIMGNEEMAKGNLVDGFSAYEMAMTYSRKTSNLHILSNITSTLASHKMGLGKYKEGYKLCTDLIEFTKEKGYYEVTKTSWEFAGLYTMMAVMQCVRADFDDAYENVKIAYELSKDKKNIIPRIMTLLAYTYILYPLGDKDGSRAKLAEFEEVIQQFPVSPFITNNYVGWKIYLLTDTNEIDKANDFAANNDITLVNEISYENNFSYIHFVRLLILQYRIKEATSILNRIEELAISHQGIEILVQVYITYALLYNTLGKHQDAVNSILKAMEFASDELLINYFLLDLKTTKTITDDALNIIAISKTNISDAFVDKLKGAIALTEKRYIAKTKPILSKREVETLVLLGEDISNQEIADKLFISLNTVKTRLKNIFLKLEVKNRHKAFQKGKEQGII